MREYEFPWVTFRLGKRLFGLDSSHVKEMHVMQELSRLPNAAEYIKGAINLRGAVILVMDLRMKMGMKSAAQEIEELIELLGKREQDHHNWINELENSVKESREFKLTTNPHACAFGKWYDAYKAPNIILEAHLKKFDAPHKRIHAIGVEAVELVKDGKSGEALALVERERGLALAQLVNLFAEAKKLLRETLREIVIILKKDDKTVGVTVDAIDSVEYLKEGTIDEIAGIEAFLKNGLVASTGKTAKGEKIVMLVNVERIFSDVKSGGNEADAISP